MGILNKHATQRLYDRSFEVTKKELKRALQNKSNIDFIKRLTESRSMVYIMCGDDKIVKAIINRKTKDVITVLPWKGEYKHLTSYHHEKCDRRYKIVLYPDAYLETNNSSHLTKIYLVHDDEQEEQVAFNHPHFEYLFNYAWGVYLNAKVEIK